MRYNPSSTLPLWTLGGVELFLLVQNERINSLGWIILVFLPGEVADGKEKHNKGNIWIKMARTDECHLDVTVLYSCSILLSYEDGVSNLQHSASTYVGQSWIYVQDNWSHCAPFLSIPQRNVSILLDVPASKNILDLAPPSWQSFKIFKWSHCE